MIPSFWPVTGRLMQYLQPPEETFSRNTSPLMCACSLRPYVCVVQCEQTCRCVCVWKNLTYWICMLVCRRGLRVGITAWQDCFAHLAPYWNWHPLRNTTMNALYYVSFFTILSFTLCLFFGVGHQYNVKITLTFRMSEWQLFAKMEQTKLFVYMRLDVLCVRQLSSSAFAHLALFWLISVFGLNNINQWTNSIPLLPAIKSELQMLKHT